MRHIRSATAWWFLTTTFFLAWVIGLKNGEETLALLSWLASAAIAIAAEGFAIKLTINHQHGGWWALAVAVLYFGIRPANFWLSLLCVALGGVAGLLFAQPIYRYMVLEKTYDIKETNPFWQFFHEARMKVVDRAA